ncbi:acetyl/propionyl/methylcrotonyl-CoA carboxylase subunit alpha [Cryobacterium sp. TMS1-20-1]|uniref:acetyl-CoA carboxylase biotin carboxylase subunit n=1 Tax=Cryobacterium sp. TMS1-20-1 TaxID=1259223 RepID=UPI0018E08234|nr:biotin carboxylase N-terminal domain-containing protein [Cryobacterium sp. TMS1-20-1]
MLVANRGEIAVRIIRACFDEGIESVLIVSAADRDSLAARLADEVVVIGPASATESYLSVSRVVQAALNAGCDALHPGYGFLSERPTLVKACEENGITFIGPSAEVMRESGDKLLARAMAESVGIPTGKGTVGLLDAEDAIRAADELNCYPLLLKASAGGGGRGMTIVRHPDDLLEGFNRSSTEAERAFGDGTVYLEPYIEKARHIEVQILADTHGNVRHLGERDCSAQRRYQKIIEEAPSVGLPEALVARIREAAVKLAISLHYVGAATCEFLVDVQRDSFVFLELNARVQVEHPVTEAITGVDIIREQIRIARGEALSFSQEDVRLTGHAVECRINAENPDSGFLPTPGTVTEWTIPQGSGVRVDTYMCNGAVVPPYYDSLIAKIIVHAPTREEAVAKMATVLAKSRVRGISTTIGIQLEIMNDPTFSTTPITTKWLEESFLPGRSASNAATMPSTTRGN